MTSYGYIIMTIVDSCMIWFDFDCIMQLQKSYHITTNVCSRKSATTFGDLPDWKRRRNVAARRLIVVDSNIPEFIKKKHFRPAALRLHRAAKPTLPKIKVCNTHAIVINPFNLSEYTPFLRQSTNMLGRIVIWYTGSHLPSVFSAV